MTADNSPDLRRSKMLMARRNPRKSRTLTRMTDAGRSQFIRTGAFRSLTPSSPFSARDVGFRRGMSAEGSTAGGWRGTGFGSADVGPARLARWGKNTKAAGSPVRAGGAISTEK